MRTRKIGMPALLVLAAFAGNAVAQQPPVSAGTDAAASPAASDAAITGRTVTRDATGQKVLVTSELPDPAPHDYRAEFNAMDSNGDGSLSTAEASTDKHLEKTFASYDSDGKARLSFEEARSWLED